MHPVPTLPDERLVQAVLEGERDAFAHLVERYKRGIASFIGASVRQPSDVADLTQETFLRAYAHLATFNPDLGRFATWLYHIARNVVRTFLGDGKKGNEDGPKPRFHEPNGLSGWGDKLFIADTNNHAIRVCDLKTGVVSTLPVEMK